MFVPARTSVDWIDFLLKSNPVYLFSDSYSGSVPINLGTYGSAGNGAIIVGVDNQVYPYRNVKFGYFDGVNDYIDIFTTHFANNFKTIDGSIIQFFQANSSVFNDGTIRYLFRVVDATADGITILRPTSNNTIQVRYRGNSTDHNSFVNITSYGVHSIAMIYDNTNNVYSVYLDGSIVTSIPLNNDFTGTPLVGLIGAGNNSPAAVFQGNILPLALYDRVLTPSEVLYYGGV